MIKTNDGKEQVKKEIGEFTGFADSNLLPILVGDFMTINHGCNCKQCRIKIRCQILWNDEWKAYGMRDSDGHWQSGMGIASGYEKGG